MSDTGDTVSAPAVAAGAGAASVAKAAEIDRPAAPIGHADAARPAEPAPAATTPRMRAPRSIRFYLTLLVMASMVPMVLVSSWLLVQDYQAQRARLVDDSVRSARSLIASVDHELAAARTALLALASSPFLSSGDLARFQAQASEVQRQLMLGNVVLIDASGQQRVNTLRPYGEPLPIERNRALLDVLGSGKPVVTDLFIGAVSGKPVLGVAVPVRQGTAVQYVLAVAVYPERLSGLLVRERLPAGAIAGVFDTAGSIVARSHEIDRFLGRKGAPELVARMKRESEGSLEATSVEGIALYSSFSKSSETGWSAAVGIPREVLVGKLRHTLLRLALAAALLLAGGLAIASLIGARISASIRALTAPAHALGHGEPVSVPALRLREPDEVGRALTQTSEVLQLALHRAQHDPLTGLANRMLFEASVQQAWREAQRSHEPFAVLYLDLDHFKQVNDRLGHAVGDDVLRIAARRLAAALRASDVGARLGGDEFAVLLPRTGAEGARRVATLLVDALALPWEPRGSAPQVSASIGIAIYPESASTVETLLHRADQALYQAKACGRNRFAMASPHAQEGCAPT